MPEDTEPMPGLRRGRKNRSLLACGIDCLSRREHSRQELRAKLLRRLAEGETPEDAEAVLDRLEELGYLSAGRFAESYVRSHAPRMGNQRLAAELRSRGLGRDEIDTALELAGDERGRALAVWKAKFGEAPADRRERDRQVRFLAARGFSLDVIFAAVPRPGESPED